MKILFQFLSKWWNLALLFCLFILFNFLLNTMMPKEYALDLMFAYSALEAYESVGNMNPEQLKSYRVGIWALDMPYMGIYCLLFSGLLIKVWKNVKVAWLPVSILVMDLFENLSVFRILVLYPTEQLGLAATASFFSTSKWVLIAALLLTFVFGLIFNLFFKKNSSVKSTGAGI